MVVLLMEKRGGEEKTRSQIRERSGEEARGGWCIQFIAQAWWVVVVGLLLERSAGDRAKLAEWRTK